MAKTGNSPVRIILTGPESTGKTMLCIQLAEKYGGELIPEYAREYILQLGRKYTYYDVLHIAEKQVELMHKYIGYSCNYLFVDTYLIITKVWFQWVFKKVPGWIDGEISGTGDALYLLCKPDIPWEPDAVRENGGENRQLLFEEYERELNRFGLRYACVEGTGDDRFNCAMNRIKNFVEL